MHAGGTTINGEKSPLPPEFFAPTKRDDHY
jgi:hypothetical protein